MKTMTGFFLLSCWAFSAHAAPSNTREVLGQVVAEKRVYTLAVEDCRKTFKRETYGSVCTVRDESHNAPGEVKIPGGTDAYEYSEARGGRGASQSLHLVPVRNGYTVSFAQEGDGGLSRALDFDSAQPLLEKAIRELGGRIEVYVYTTSK